MNPIPPPPPLPLGHSPPGSPPLLVSSSEDFSEKSLTTEGEDYKKPAGSKSLPGEIFPDATRKWKKWYNDRKEPFPTLTRDGKPVVLAVKFTSSNIENGTAILVARAAGPAEPKLDNDRDNVLVPLRNIAKNPAACYKKVVKWKNVYYWWEEYDQSWNAESEEDVWKTANEMFAKDTSKHRTNVTKADLIDKDASQTPADTSAKDTEAPSNKKVQKKEAEKPASGASGTPR